MKIIHTNNNGLFTIKETQNGVLLKGLVVLIMKYAYRIMK